MKTDQLFGNGLSPARGGRFIERGRVASEQTTQAENQPDAFAEERIEMPPAVHPQVEATRRRVQHGVTLRQSELLRRGTPARRLQPGSRVDFQTQGRDPALERLEEQAQCVAERRG